MTPENIVQMAVANLGETTVVNSITAPVTKTELLGQLFYSVIRDRILAKHDWSWATRRAALTDVTATEITAPNRLGWTFAYTFPADLLRFIDIDLGFRSGPAPATFDPLQPTQIGARWTIEMNTAGTGRVLLCDIGAAVGVYTAQITNLALWDPDAIEALVWSLSFALAMPLAVKQDFASLARQMAEQTLNRAIADDANEARPDPVSTSEIISARDY